MLKNYLKIARRNLTRHYLYFIVNLIGLSLGIACSIVAYTNWEFHADFDGGHVNGDEIFKVNSVRQFEEQLQNYGVTPQPLADFIRGESSQVSHSTRYSIHTEVVKLDEKVIRQEVAYVDPNFFDVFTFHLESGNYSSLNRSNQVYLTVETAKLYYADSDPLGKPLSLITSKGEELELSIAGVVEDHPLNSSFKFGVLLNHELYKEIYDINNEDWAQFTHSTFLVLNDKEDKNVVEKELQRYVGTFNESREDWVADSFYLVSLDDMANQARYIHGNYLGFNNPEGAIMIPIIMGFIILLVACFNFMNTSISLSGKRLKEIAVRKAVGARRSQLTFQLLSENFIILLMSLGLGILIAEYLLPLYSQLGPWIDLEISYNNNIPFFSFLLGLLIVTAILSGAYPAFYISKFNTSNIFSGRFKIKGSGGLSKWLMVLQLGFSLIALIQGIVYVQNTYLQEQFDLGYKKHGVITIPFSSELNVKSFRDDIKSYSGIKGVSGSRHHIGYNLTGGIVEINAQRNEVQAFEVGENYLETMEISILSGRTFHKNSKTEMEESIIVNEQFLIDFDLKNAIDQRVLLDDKPYHIVGVAKDFFPFGLWRGETNNSIVLKLTATENFRFIIANVIGDLDEADQFLKSRWVKMFPYTPYESDKENIHVYRSELLSGNMAVMNIFLAAITILLSATGLFTLISINVQKKTKEIGVRKILGASTLQVIHLINKGFIWVILVSIVLGTVAGTYLTEMFLDIMFAIHAHVGGLAVGITAGLLILIVVLSAGYKVFQAANHNPVESLKYE